MPSSKKAPSMARKKVTASARARISTRKIRKDTHKDLNESYIQATLQPQVSTMPSNSNQDPDPRSTDSSNAILSMLTELSESNRALLTRIEKIEQKQSAVTYGSQTPPRLHTTERFPHIPAHTVGREDRQRQVHLAPFNATSQQINNEACQDIRQRIIPEAMGSAQAAATATTQFEVQNDGVLPRLETLRQIPSVSNTVSTLLGAYEEQARTSLQGRQPRKSGRYNSVEVVQSAPEFRWPNEGYHAPGGKKRVIYDELTLPQWVVGQLTNIYHMKDQTTARNALLQVILAMKDATSLPWAAVRSAWATSMHDLEEGNLAWRDTTQWSINRLSASQISMSGTQANQQNQAKKNCRFFNEGVCSHDSSHGNYKHVCNFCDKQGKTAAHPESKCFQKLKSKDKQAAVS